MTLIPAKKRCIYDKEKMLAIKDWVSDASDHFFSKYPVNIPYKTRVRMKTTSTCSNHNLDDPNELLGSKTSLGPNSGEHSDSEDHGNAAAWRRVTSNRGRGGLSRQRFPSGSTPDGEHPSHNFNRGGGDWNHNNQQPLWRQRTTSGSDQQNQPGGRGFFHNNRGRGGLSTLNDNHNGTNDSWTSFKPRIGRGRGFIARGRGSFNRNSYVDHNGHENSHLNPNFRHSYHAQNSNGNHGQEDDEPQLTEISETVPPGLQQAEKPKEPELEKPIWLYIDPQDKIQGPFTTSAMSQWFKLGYLPETLQLRKVTEPDFTTLEQLCSSSGLENPFKAQASLPTSTESTKNQQSTPKTQSFDDPMSLITKFNPKEVEAHFINFAREHYSHLSEPKLIMESLLKLSMDEICQCLSDETFLRKRIEELPGLNAANTAPVAQVPSKSGHDVDATGDWQCKKTKIIKKCAINEDRGGFHFEVEHAPVEEEQPFAVHSAVESNSVAELSSQLSSNVRLDEQQHQSEEGAKSSNSAKKKSKKKNANTKPAEEASQQAFESLSENETASGWISASKGAPKSGSAVADPGSGKKKKKGKKTESDAKTTAWEVEMERRKREQAEKLKSVEAEEAAYQQMIAEQERQKRQEEQAEAQSAIAALERREKRFQQTNLMMDSKAPGAAKTYTPYAQSMPPATKPAKVTSFAQIQAEQFAQEAALKDLQLKNLQGMSQKAATAALNKPTGWASIAAVNAGQPRPVVTAPVVPAVQKKAAAQTPAAPAKERAGIWGMDSNATAAVPQSKSAKKATKPTNGHPAKNDMKELKHWCQIQLGNLPPINCAIDLPTVTGLVCEMENAGEVTEFIETSFGNSKKVKKFTQELIQRKSKVVL